MESLNEWRLCDELTAYQAALLHVGTNPALYNMDTLPMLQTSQLPPGFNSAFSAISGAIRKGSLKASIRSLAKPRYSVEPYLGKVDAHLASNRAGTMTVCAVAADGTEYLISSEPDWAKTTVNVDDLRDWMVSRGIAGGFFFPDPVPEQPDFLDSSDPRYAPKLAAAVSAWLACGESVGKSPKQVLENWLRTNAMRFGLIGSDGEPVSLAIEECAKVANWQTKGGAPKTPG